MKEPVGVTFEIGCTDNNGKRKFFIDVSPLKLRKMRASYKGVDTAYGGIKVDLMIGSWRRPVPKLLERGFYKRGSVPYEIWEQEYNPWNSGNHWFEIPDIVFPSFFISIGKEDNEIYFGSKSFEVDKISQNRKTYMPDRNDIFHEDNAWGKEKEKGNIYLALSACIRLQFLKDWWNG